MKSEHDITDGTLPVDELSERSSDLAVVNKMT